jgi:hypothetical protein
MKFRRAAIVIVLGLLASVGIARPAAADAFVCVDAPYGGGCVTVTHPDNPVIKTRLDVHLLDLWNDDLVTSMTVFLWTSDGSESRQLFYVARNPDMSEVRTEERLSIDARWMSLRACGWNRVTGEESCNWSRLANV